MTESAGETLREALSSDRVFTDAQTAVLEQACALADELARLEAALAVAPVLTTGSLGQERAHPLFAETRATRALLAQLIKQLHPLNGETRRDRAVSAARARWGRGEPAQPSDDNASRYEDYRNL